MGTDVPESYMLVLNPDPPSTLMASSAIRSHRGLGGGVQTRDVLLAAVPYVGDTTDTSLLDDINYI